MKIQTRVEERFSRRGFTLIEALVAIGIVSILLALLLPAVQMARESARGLQCRANLRQIGIAMHGYHAIHEMFPPSRLEIGPGYTADTISAWAFLLPQLEQQPLFSQVNFEVLPYDSAERPLLVNRTARDARLAVFLCPSDGSPDRGMNYRLNRGIHDPERCGVPFCGPFSGSWDLPRQSRMRDGLSRTAFVSERIAGTFLPGLEDATRDIRSPVSPIPFEVLVNDAVFIPFCLTTEHAEWEHTAGRYWFYSGFHHTLYNHNGRPNDDRPSCGYNYGLHPPRSYHPGMVNVLFGDGHVEAITESVAPDAWQALGTHNLGD